MRERAWIVFTNDLYNAISADNALGDEFNFGKTDRDAQSGTDFKLSGHGVPYPRSERRGAHIVSIIVDTPTKLSKKQRELLEQFEASKKRGIFS